VSEVSIRKVERRRGRCHSGCFRLFEAFQLGEFLRCGLSLPGLATEFDHPGQAAFGVIGSLSFLVQADKRPTVGVANDQFLAGEVEADAPRGSA
jgi:hypothetical protein